VDDSEAEPRRARPPRRRIDGAAKARFLAALRAGEHRDEAARKGGHSWRGFYGARRRDPVFALGWGWALELSAADERAKEAGAAGAGGTEIAPNNQRRLQRRKRQLRFTDARKRVFLDFFAGTADAFAAAQAAGVGYSTVYEHRRKDPVFAEAYDETLAQAYAMLEAETVRQRLEAQRDLREGRLPLGEMAQEFERAMKLLARYDRRDGRVGTREVRRGRERRWSFDEAIAALDKRLRALGLRRGVIGEGHE
jgi:hypothetical protein